MSATDNKAPVIACYEHAISVHLPKHAAAAHLGGPIRSTIPEPVDLRQHPDG